MTNLFDLTGKTILVTGASRGLGRELALGFARAGADLVVTARSASALEEVVNAIRAEGRDALAIVADLATPEGSALVAEQALAWKGTVDVLVNNAGYSEPTPFLETDDAQFERVFAINFTAVVRLTRAIGAHMIARKSGSVILIGSALGRTAIPGNVSYLATKGALEQLGRGLAVEWARKGVRVNTIAPGFFETEIVPEVTGEGGLGEYVRQADADATRGRAARARERRALSRVAGIDLRHGIDGERRWWMDGGVARAGRRSRLRERERHHRDSDADGRDDERRHDPSRGRR